MKCINRSTKQWLAVLLCTAMALSFSGCAKNEAVKNAYDVTNSTFGLLSETSSANKQHFLSADLCIANEDIAVSDVDMSQAESAGLFDITNHETLFAKNVHEKLYPASTTKILTAYITLKYADLDSLVTISAENVQLENGSSHCGLQEGVQITVRELLYGLLLKSANDAANALADHISGSTEAFAELMNEEAALLGATNSHFVNAHGLHNDEHYTTVYDLYLIFQAALKNDTFREITGTTSHLASYLAADQSTVTVKWENTMQYFTKNKIPPEGVTVLAGKTGTTSKALSCLVLLSENAEGEEFISIILKSKDRGILYDEMNDLLEEINK